MALVTPATVSIILYILVGILLNKILPMSRLGWRKWIWNRKGISYFVCHILDNSSIINTNVIKESKGEYKYKKGRYVLWVKTDDKNYFPYINYRGERVIFHNKNNLSPLEYKSKTIEPASNDPEIFANMITNHEISDTLNPLAEQFKPLKRLIVVSAIIIIIGLSFMMWALTSGAI